MPRGARAAQGGFCYHALNRGNGRRTVFHQDGDFAAFRKLLAEAGQRTRMRLLAYCLMPNHFHLAVWHAEDGQLSDYMGWLLTAHVRRYHQHYHSSCHVWQGRFRAFAIQEDEHLLAVLRYLERNPVRAGLVARAATAAVGRRVGGWNRCAGARGSIAAAAVPRPNNPRATRLSAAVRRTV